MGTPLEHPAPKCRKNGPVGSNRASRKAQWVQGVGCIAQLVEQLTLNQPLSQRFQRPISQTCYNSPLKTQGNLSRFPNGSRICWVWHGAVKTGFLGPETNAGQNRARLQILPPQWVMDGVSNLMSETIVELIVVGWTESVPPADDPEAWTVELGVQPPVWAWNAIVRGDIVPLPMPERGDNDWGRGGVMIKATGQTYPLGASISKAALPPPPEILK